MVRLKEEIESSKLELLDESWSEIGDNVEIFRLPGNEPVRRIITGRRTQKTGGFWSWKNMAHVVHESGGEEFCARVLELHPYVEFFFGQPEKIRFAVDGADRKAVYTPDFLIVSGNRNLRVEFKYHQDVRPPRPVRDDDEHGWNRFYKAARLRARLRDVRAAYRRAGLRWILITDVRLASLVRPATIHEIVANCGRPIAQSDESALLDFLARQPHRTASLAECEQQLSVSDFPRGDILSRIPERMLKISLNAPISGETRVTLRNVPL